MAASQGHADAVHYLLSFGADPHQILKDSSTCLLEASKNGHTECVEILLDYGLQSQRYVKPSSKKNTNKSTKENNSSMLTHSKSTGNIPKVIKKNF